MEPHRNPRVLSSGAVPSNAPALPDCTTVQRSSPELRTSTSSTTICVRFNRGVNCRPCTFVHICSTCRQPDHGAIECKEDIPCVTSGKIGSGASLAISRNLTHKAQNFQGYGIRPSIFSTPTPHEPQSIIKWEHNRPRTTSLSRLPNHWHCEFDTPRYCAYREKCRQRGSKDAVQWPDDVENAFQLAIRYYRRRGRKKAELNGKPSGGNEFIADYIEKTTGVKRDRKKVSSHIQVLKGFLSENHRWMSLVVDIKPDKSTRRHRQETRFEESTVAYGREIYHDSTHHQSQYPGVPMSLVHDIDSGIQRGPTIRSVEFQMTLYEESQISVHTYTSIQCEAGTLPRTLDEVNEWRSMFPQLASYCDNGEVECPLFLFETQLNLMHRYPGGSCQLGAELYIDFTHGTDFTDWCSLTRFYEETGNEIDLSRIHADGAASNTPYDEIQCSEVETTTDMRLEIRMKSKWWARKFSGFLARKLEAEGRAATTGNSQIVKEEDRQTRQYLSEISIMQEIWATSQSIGAQPQRMAILIWRFDETQNGEAPTTSWRPIILPATPFQLKSPSPIATQIPLVLDSALEAPIAPQLTHPYPDYYNPQPSIFLDTADTLLALGQGDGSSPDTPSFSSSTSTSFPSSISDSTYGVHQSQELSHDPQGSGYPIFSSFDSQESQEPYESQDDVFHSQYSLYHTVTTPLYDYPTQDYIDLPQDRTKESMTAHNFTCGEIQLLYAPHAEPARSYEPPLIAPRANMMAQPQVIEQLENFEYRDPEEPHQGLGPDQSGLQQTYAEHFSQQNLDMNLLATHFSAWEEQIDSQQEVELDLGGHVVDDQQQITEDENQLEETEKVSFELGGQGDNQAKDV